MSAWLGRLSGRNPALVLLLGTAAAQAIPVLSSPLLTRLYSPEAFGAFSVYMSVLGVAGIAASGRYEMAIAGQRDSADTDTLLTLVMLLSVAVLLLLLPLSQVAGGLLATPALVWVAPAAALYAVFQGATYWLTYRGRFGLLSLAKIFQAVVVVLGALLLARQAPGTGLIGASMLGYLVAVVATLWMVSASGFRLASPASVWTAAKRHLNFPLYGLLPAMLDSFSMLIPVWIVADQFGTQEAGYLGLSRQVLAAPVALLAMTSAQILLKKVGDRVRRGEGVTDSFLQATRLALAVAACLVAVIGLFGAELFAWVFGAQWWRAGEYSSLLVWAYASILVVSPLSAYLTVLHEVKLNGLWQGLHLGGIATLFLLDFNRDLHLLQVYVLIEVGFYIFYWALIYRAVKRADHAGIRQ